MNHGIVHLIHRLAAACSGAGIAWSWVHYHGLFNQVIGTIIFAGSFLAQTNWNEIRRERNAKRDNKDSERAGVDRVDNRQGAGAAK